MLKKIIQLVADMEKGKQKSRRKTFGNHHLELSGQPFRKNSKSVGFKIKNLDQFEKFHKRFKPLLRKQKKKGGGRIEKLELLLERFPP